KAMHIRQTSLPQPPVQHGGEQSYLFLVADGVGVHVGGEKASALVVDSIESFMLNTFKWFFQLKGNEENAVLAEFRAALRQADARLFAEAADRPELSGTGSTLTLAYSLDNELFVAPDGDSRCYLVRNEPPLRLTQSHTTVE